MNQQQHRYLTAMGITVWQYRATQTILNAKAAGTSELRTNTERGAMKPSAIDELDASFTSSKPKKPQTAPIFPPVTSIIDCSTMDWSSLETSISQCQQCSLAQSRTQTVFGVGSQNAQLMVIGGTPNDDDDRQGRPFIGSAGQLLNNMLMAIDIPLHTTYITNLVKCRPPNNRDPSNNELHQCNQYIHRQIQLVKPKLILVVGRVAAQTLLQANKSLSQLRGTIHTLETHDIPVIATYHPSYLLRQTSGKRKTWEDLKKVSILLKNIHLSHESS